MMNNVSWTQFAISVAIALVIYYSVVVACYYKDEILFLFQSIKHTNDSNVSKPDDNNDLYRVSNDRLSEAPFTPAFENDKDYLAHITVDLIMAIDEIFDRARSRNFSEGELKDSFMFLLTGYTILTNSSYAETVNNYIIHHSEKNCSIHLNVEEVRLLWPKNGEWS